MPNYFSDTSAIVKHYLPQPGAARVDALLAIPGSDHGISRLTNVEFHSVIAKKVRIGAMTPTEFGTVSLRFRRDVAAKRFRLARLTVPHYRSAERLIRRLGRAQNLRTLDALQLAVALSLNDPGRSVVFVCADQALCAIAAAEGLTVVNPELP